MRIIKTLLILCIAFTTSIFAEDFDRAKFAENAELVTPILNGQTIPDVSLKTVNGQSVRLLDLVAEKPTVILFYRGGWCPYCNRQLAGLQAIEERMVKLGYQILAISPDTPARLKEQETTKKYAVTLLSDSSLNAIKAFGIGYYLDPEYAKRGSFIGADTILEDGTKRRVLPVPAVYIADDAGLVNFNYVNPNFRVRLEPELLFQAARISKK